MPHISDSRSSAISPLQAHLPGHAKMGLFLQNGFGCSQRAGFNSGRPWTTVSTGVVFHRGLMREQELAPRFRRIGRLRPRHAIIQPPEKTRRRRQPAASGLGGSLPARTNCAPSLAETGWPGQCRPEQTEYTPHYQHANNMPCRAMSGGACGCELPHIRQPFQRY